MSKNIVICCDGTGNEIEEKQSNVLKLYRILKRSDRQIVYYHPGIGTHPGMGATGEVRMPMTSFPYARRLLGLVTGAGLDSHILQVYHFLVSNFEEGDQLYFFGFSRGAYVVRALAGFIYTVGLLKREQIHHAPYMLVAYKKLMGSERSRKTQIFEQSIKADYPTIQFMGLWDTVSSVLIPRSDRPFSIPSFRSFAFTQHNNLVVKVRHALAIDERRSMFRPYFWADDGEHRANPYNEASAKKQDIEQRWFAGVHSDVGGGYAEQDSGLSKLSLNWMIDEAGPGLWTISQTRNQIAKGEKRANSPWDYSKPEAHAKLHESLNKGWWPFELWPKKIKHREWPRRWNILGAYFPFGEPRHIPGEHVIDPSVRERQAAIPEYNPINLREED